MEAYHSKYLFNASYSFCCCHGYVYYVTLPDLAGMWALVGNTLNRLCTIQDLAGMRTTASSPPAQ